jgi:hypothetical protein
MGRRKEGRKEERKKDRKKKEKERFKCFGSNYKVKLQKVQTSESRNSNLKGTFGMPLGAP